jgi:hypothetical protein
MVCGALSFGLEDHCGYLRISLCWSRSVHICGITVSFAIVSASLHRTRYMAESVNIVAARLPVCDVVAVFAEG